MKQFSKKKYSCPRETKLICKNQDQPMISVQTFGFVFPEFSSLGAFRSGFNSAHTITQIHNDTKLCIQNTFSVLTHLRPTQPEETETSPLYWSGFQLCFHKNFGFRFVWSGTISFWPSVLFFILISGPGLFVPVSTLRTTKHETF